jgi:hypothetical protein
MMEPLRGSIMHDGLSKPSNDGTAPRFYYVLRII